MKKKKGKRKPKKQTFFIINTSYINFDCKYLKIKKLDKYTDVYSCLYEKLYKKYGKKDIRLIGCQGCDNDK